MLKITITFFLLTLMASCVTEPEQKETPEIDGTGSVILMTLDPGHFHAALIQKTMYPEVDSTVYMFAPEGAEAADFLGKIDAYNGRIENPTDWNTEVYLGDDFLRKMIEQKPGNVMIVAGKNDKKIGYVLAAVKAGINVYADKPLVINKEGFEKLEEAFKIAKEKGVMIYDIMTERFEETTAMQKQFSMSSEVFGELIDGTPEKPAISKESVHHFSKIVSGKPLTRPAWFFDAEQEGEGIVDVTTHLVDLVQWEAFPEQIIDRSDIEMLRAKHWATTLTPKEFEKVTKLTKFSDYLEKDVVDGKLNVLCNGEMLYKIKGKHAKVSVIWNFEAPAGTGDTHYSIMRGTKADLIIKQGEAEGYKPTLYIQLKNPENGSEILQKVIAERIKKTFDGTTVEQTSADVWKVNIDDKYKLGHEAHFAQVTRNYLGYLKAGKLPDWEVPNILTKYYTTIAAYQLAQKPL
ncbi:MAG: putative dehydrogenase [Spirosomataceae bacterium]|jgi:predicted dehydrogenase